MSVLKRDRCLHCSSVLLCISIDEKLFSTQVFLNLDLVKIFSHLCWLDKIAVKLHKKAHLFVEKLQ